MDKACQQTLADGVEQLTQQLGGMKGENERLRRDNERFVRLIDSGEWGRGRVAELTQAGELVLNSFHFITSDLLTSAYACRWFQGLWLLAVPSKHYENSQHELALNQCNRVDARLGLLLQPDLNCFHYCSHNTRGHAFVQTLQKRAKEKLGSVASSSNNARCLRQNAWHW